MAREFFIGGPFGTSLVNDRDTRQFINQNGVIVETPAAATGIKVWNGSAWVIKPLKYWNGSAWVSKTLKRWTGSAWVAVGEGGAPAIVAPAFRSIANTSYTSRNDTDIPVPAGTALNDILIASLIIGKNTPAASDPVIPGGWAQIGTYTLGFDGSFYGKFGVYWKRASGSEPASYQWAQFESAVTQGVMAAYSGCITSGSPIDVFSQNSSNASGATATAIGVTPTQANDRLIYAGHNWQGTATLNPPLGMTERLDHLTYFSDEVTVTANVGTGNRTQTLASSNEPWAAFLIALKGI